MAGPKVTFKITTQAKFEEEEPAIVNGQILFVANSDGETGKIYLDFNDIRQCYTSDGTMGLNYIGISTTNPKSGTVTVDGVVIQAREKDMVVYKTKEYLYRKSGEKDGDGKDILGWYEIGDEDSPEWNT